MSLQDSGSEYAKRFHRVLEHIDRHLDEQLDLDTLAGVANFSPYHFHRVFSAWMGETFGEYLRRRRLEQAAARLATQPRVPVLTVAMAVGFGSGEAFARAFKTRFGASPTAWRNRERKNYQANRKRDQETPSTNPYPQASTNRSEVSMMNVKIVDRQPTFVGYMRHVGPYGPGVSEFWQNTFAPWMMENHLMNHVRFGLSHDDPEVTAPEKCRYDACVEVPKDFAGTGSYHTTTLLGGKYAVARFSGPVTEFAPAWQKLLRDWLPTSGMQLDSRPFLELYDQTATFDPKTGIMECDLCAPVAPL